MVWLVRIELAMHDNFAKGMLLVSQVVFAFHPSLQWLLHHKSWRAWAAPDLPCFEASDNRSMAFYRASSAMLSST